jgi:hypothetical protein
MTYAQEMKLKYPHRPMIGKPTWELKNMVLALSLHPWLNDLEDTKRLIQAQRELKERRKK